MDARELLNDLESGLIDEFMSAEVKAIYILALRLLAAAESNDGTTPETDDCVKKANLLLLQCDSKDEINEQHILNHHDSVVLARRLERERNGLAARVVELEPDAKKWRAFVGCARLRAIGWAELDAPTPYAHIGLEAWTIHGADSEPIAIEALEKFVAKCIAIDAARIKP